jgi:hypothetical protein
MADAAGPGPIAPVHRITIWTAFLGAAAYLAFELKQMADGASGASGLRVALALAAVGAIGAYLRHLRARLADKLTPRGSA